MTLCGCCTVRKALHSPEWPRAPGRRSGAVLGHVRAHPRDDLKGEAPELSLRRAIDPKNVAVHALRDDERGQLVDPLVDRAVEEAGR